MSAPLTTAGKRMAGISEPVAASDQGPSSSVLARMSQATSGPLL